MYLNVTRDFFFQQKPKLLMTLVSISFLVAFYLFVEVALNQEGDQAMPDFMVSANVTDPFKWDFMENFSDDFVQQVSKSLDDKARVVPVTQRFMFNIMHPILGDYRFHVLGVPHSFLQDVLHTAVISGEVPAEDSNGILIGHTLANRLQVEVGSEIEVTLGTDPQEKLQTFFVAGILNPSAYTFFDRSMIVPVETYERLSGETVADTSLLVYGNVTEEELMSVVTQTEQDTSLQLSSLRSGDLTGLTRTFATLFLIGLVCVVFYQSIQSILNRSTQQIGLLKTIGMADANVILIFVQGVILIFVIAMILGITTAEVFFNFINNQISDMLETPVNIYQISIKALLSLGAMVLVVLAVTIGNILYLTRRIPPRKAITEL